MSTQNLILIGAGGLGREVAAWIAFLGLPFRIAGFLDDAKTAPDILGRVSGHSPRGDVVYLTCLGSGSARRRIRLELEARGARFTSLVDPSVRSISSLPTSVNSIIFGPMVISNNVVIGDDLLLHVFAGIGHDVHLGHGVTVGSHVFVGGAAVLKDGCSIHPNASVLPGVTVGEHAVVGAGSVAIRNVEAGTTVFGAPAKIIARAAKAHG